MDEKTGELLEILSDKNSTGKERPWREHKIENQQVEKCYRRLAVARSSEQEYWSKRADRLQKCGNLLIFNVFEDEENGREVKKLTSSNSCRIRLCPLCTWRRSIKIQVHTRKILESMQTEGKYQYILATFTVPNVSGAELSSKLTDMMTAWHKMFGSGAGYKKLKKAVKGWYRGLEVTHNTKKDTFHPHFHCIFAVDKYYFTSHDYIQRDEWLAMWQKAMKDPTITQVDVRKVKPKNSTADSIISAVCEVAKYTVKSADYILPWNWELSCNTVAVLDSALANRRLVAFGGVMKEWHKKLNLDDEIDGNLICDDGEEVLLLDKNFLRETCAVWNVGYQQYIIHEVHEENN